MPTNLFLIVASWVLKNAPPELKLKPDSVTLKVKDIKMDELTALGLRVTKNGKIESASGKPWPSPSAHFHPITIYSGGVFFAMLSKKDC